MAKNEVVKDKVNLPANVDLESLAGAGMETVTMRDMSVPFLKILQTLSPELKKSKAEYVEGAEEGDIMNTVTGKLAKEVQVVPCFYQFVVNEWKPQRGGFVASHFEGDPIIASAVQTTDADGKRILQAKNGNVLVDTANWYVLVKDRNDQWTWGVIAFTSTQLKYSRKLMTRLQSVKMEGKNGPFTPPIYAHILEMSTVPESKGDNEWMSWKIDLSDQRCFEDHELFQKAVDFHEQVKKGLVKAIPQVEETVEPAY